MGTDVRASLAMRRGRRWSPVRRQDGRCVSRRSNPRRQRSAPLAPVTGKAASCPLSAIFAWRTPARSAASWSGCKAR